MSGSREPSSLVTQLGEPVLVEPEVVAELVQHRDADLLAELVLVGEVRLERPAVDRDAVRELAGAGPPSVSGTPSNSP